jgi:hypothetical protein
MSLLQEPVGCLPNSALDKSPNEVLFITLLFQVRGGSLT